ncbi:MAG: YifB family Mg chelatase-like AAA ATPase [Pseudomonadota bacterium]
MTLASTRSRASLGLAAPVVSVEVHLAPGLPRFSMVGMPEVAVREARDRVRAAITQAGFVFPQHAITVHLGPADLPKQGGRYDLAIAVGILAASQQVPGDALSDLELYGELSLAGELRPVPALLTAGLRAARERRAMLVPIVNSRDLARVAGLTVYGAATLAAVTAHLNGMAPLPVAQPREDLSAPQDAPDLADVHGHAGARRALEIVAAGGHNLLMSGPPGSGKSMLARRLPSLLPPLDEAEALESAAIESLLDAPRANARHTVPFRSPHHTASAAALVGGGRDPRPGEVSRAHRGVLFLDEVAEFPRHVLDTLREPLEAGRVVVSRAARQTEFPARFQLVAAMNPCPCGYDGDPEVACRCTPDQITRYRQRLSGPLLDRIDVRLTVGRLSYDELMRSPPSESSAAVASRVAAARQRQRERRGCLNAELAGALTHTDCRLDDAGQTLLETAAKRFHLSARALERVVRVARTVADLADEQEIGNNALAEALALRGVGFPG